MQRCADADIEVWGLLGEPEWLGQTNADKTKGEMAIGRSIDRILNWSEFNPGFNGVNIDIEPHADPMWDKDLSKRNDLNKKYIALLDVVVKRLSGKLPLCVDCPVKYFKTPHEALLKAIAKRADRLTAMCYSSNVKTVRKWAALCTEVSPVDITIGVELSKKAPASVNWAKMSKEMIELNVGQIEKGMKGFERFAGVALHDYQALQSLSSKLTAQPEDKHRKDKIGSKK